MIYPYFSNSYAFLKRLYIEQLSAERRRSASLTSPFDLYETVVADEAVRDDINRSLADAAGIASGVRFVTGQAWLDRMIYGSPDVTGRARSLEWAIYAVLSDKSFLGKPECARLAHYLKAAGPGAIWPLVSRLAALMTTYAAYRADWLWNWAGVTVKSADPGRRIREEKVLASHPDFAWQKALWLELVNRKREDGSRLWPAADAFLSIPERWAGQMNARPEKEAPLFVFMPRELPPLALPQLLAEGRRRDVHLYMLNPSSAFWFDPSAAHAGGFVWFHRNASVRRALIDRVRSFVSQEGEASMLEDDLEDAPRTPPRNRLVDQNDLADVLKLHAEAGETADIYVRPESDTFLAALQTAVLEDDPALLPDHADPQDESFVIVRAPNAMREVQTLCDWIGSCIEASRNTARPLKADDFLVVTPDIDETAGVVAAVMNARGEDERIAYHIAGQSELDVNAAARAMLAAMRFAGGAAGADEFNELIEMPAFAAVRGETEVNVSRVAEWLAAAGYRRGLNEEHARRAVAKKLAASEGDGPFEGTLERAIERLLAGEMTAAHKLVTDDVLSVSGDELGASFNGAVQDDPDSFAFLLSLAQAFADAGTMPEMQSMNAWLETTRRFADTLFEGYAKSPEMVAFMMRAASLAQNATEIVGEDPVSFETWCSSLEKTMRGSKTAVRASGRVTFAGTGDFADMPFRCVAVIGLNDGESFPGSSRREEFDLTAAQTTEDGKVLNAARRGDRDSRASNRGVFLDLILAARERFYVSYSIGSDAVPANPSVVLQDLRQALAEGLEDKEEIDTVLTKTAGALVSAEENFAPGMGCVRSRSPARARAVNEALAKGYVADEPAFADAPLVTQTDAGLSVDNLEKFFEYAESKSLSLLGISTAEDTKVESTPVKRLGGDDYAYRARVRRRVYEGLQEGLTADQIRAIAACDPTIGDKSVRGLLVEKTVKTFEELYRTIRVKQSVDGTEKRLEGGKIVFESMKGRAFGSLAVPSLDVVDGADGRRTAVFEGISSKDAVRAFVRFAAFNVLAEQRGEAPVDAWFIGAEVEKETVTPRFWSTARRGPDSAEGEEPKNTVQTLRRVLERLLGLLDSHVEGRLILSGGYELKEADSILWRGTAGFDKAETASKEVVKALEGLISLFVSEGPKAEEETQEKAEEMSEKTEAAKKGARKGTSAKRSSGSRKAKGDPVEAFELACAKLEAVGRTEGGKR